MAPVASEAAAVTAGPDFQLTRQESHAEVVVTFQLGTEPISKHDVSVRFQRRYLQVLVRGATAIDGELAHAVDPSECSWYFEQQPSKDRKAPPRRTLVVNLMKAVPGQFWLGVLRSEALQKHIEEREKLQAMEEAKSQQAPGGNTPNSWTGPIIEELPDDDAPGDSSAQASCSVTPTCSTKAASSSSSSSSSTPVGDDEKNKKKGPPASHVKLGGGGTSTSGQKPPSPSQVDALLDQCARAINDVAGTANAQAKAAVLVDQYARDVADRAANAQARRCRELCADDFQALVRLWGKAGAERPFPSKELLVRHLGANKGVNFVAEQGNEVCGLAIAGVARPFGVIRQVLVRARSAKASSAAASPAVLAAEQEVRAALLDRTVAALRAAGCSSVEVLVPINEPQGFWERSSKGPTRFASAI